jgi:hypothetical protein
MQEELGILHIVTGAMTMTGRESLLFIVIRSWDEIHV